MKNILFLDDDVVSQKMVSHALGSDFKVISCYTIAEAQELIRSQVEIAAVLIDRGLPDGDGLSLCTSLRQEGQFQNIPVIFLSSANTEIDKVTAFFAGADDYVTKPFGLLELKARILAKFRNSSKKLYAADLEVDLDSFRVHHRGAQKNQEIDLTRTEFKILVALMQSIENVAHREILLAKVWGDACHVTDRVVDSHISHLRKKISQTGLILESLRGEGYRLSARARLSQAA